MGWRRLDTALLALVLVAVGWFLYRVEIGLSYQWNWAAIPQYLVRYDPERGWVANFLIQGLFMTIKLSIWALILAMPLALIVGLLRVSSHLFNRLTGTFYVGLLRNLPPLVLILLFYYFVSDQILPKTGIADAVASAPESFRSIVELFFAPVAYLESFIAAIVTLALFEGAYLAEIVRAGIESLESGQWQAGMALGMRRWQLLRTVILPQAFQRMIPPLAGQFISTIKDSSIVSVISIQELTFQGMELMASTYLTFEIWLTVAALYFFLTWSCSLVAGKLERTFRFNE
ncbi:MAG: amino acid ABC transporter permease [Desulfuromonas sp.]|nr:MAG: amino acid ABC transporter permease [Desulfuromonas sp.]